jgi:hypothetical protein
MKNPQAFSRAGNEWSAELEWIASPSQQGMTLRDYFAAKAMVAFINSDEWQSTVGDVSRIVAFNAYAVADAMLEERK